MKIEMINSILIPRISFQTPSEKSSWKNYLLIPQNHWCLIEETMNVNEFSRYNLILFIKING